MSLYLACGMTMAMETAYFLLIGYRDRDFLIVCLAANAATNLTLNLILRNTGMNGWMVGLLEILEEKGSELRLPYSCSLGDGIFELRCKQGSNISRILYFFYFGQHIIITNGFVKKSQQTPAGEIQLAKKRRDDWIKRNARAKR